MRSPDETATTRRRLEAMLDVSRHRADALATLGLETVAAYEMGVLPAVRDALHRLDRGTYGACEACAGSIDAARLSAVPYARRCRACQREAAATWRDLDAMIGDRVATLAGEPQGPMRRSGSVRGRREVTIGVTHRS